MKTFYLVAAILLLTGCALRPIRPGTGKITVPNGIVSEIKQPENPKEPSTQVIERKTETVSPDGTKVVHQERAEQKVGAAQKDTAREAAAKLASLRPVTWVGVLLFLFGVASAFYPPLKLIVGSVTTSAAAAAAGLALIVLPTLVVGHEILIMGVGVGVLGVWFLAHRHGHLRGQLAILKGDK